MKGPFYMLDSKEGLKEDKFKTCGQHDLIDAANTKPPQILLIGKPRAGKTSLAKSLSVSLDLIHVSVEIWVNTLLVKLAKIKEGEAPYEIPEDLEEGQEPPKFTTELESAV
jgi:hypothetical protein